MVLMMESTEHLHADGAQTVNGGYHLQTGLQTGGFGRLGQGSRFAPQHALCGTLSIAIITPQRSLRSILDSASSHPACSSVHYNTSGN